MSTQGPIAKFKSLRGRPHADPSSAGGDRQRDDELPFACPRCGDRSVAPTECDPCGVAMVRTSQPAPYR